jgi:DNA-binding NarL/FixJ family response regulator
MIYGKQCDILSHGARFRFSNRSDSAPLGRSRSQRSLLTELRGALNKNIKVCGRCHSTKSGQRSKIQFSDRLSILASFAMKQNDIRCRVQLEAFSKAVEAVYDCAVDSIKWTDALGRIVELCSCRDGSLGVIDLENVRNKAAFHVGHDVRYLRLYEEKYAAMDPITGLMQLLPVGTVATRSMSLDESKLLKSTFYREFLKPQRIGDCIGFNVLKTQKRIGALIFNRLKSQGRFGDVEVRLLTLLAPHVCRSVAISDALNLKTIKSEAVEATLDALATSVYLINREGHIVYMNRAAEFQIKTSTALRIDANRLIPVDREARAALVMAMDEAISHEAETPESGFQLALPEKGKAGLVATILPLTRGERCDLGDAFDAIAAIFVQDPIVAPSFPGEAFAKLYGLTGSELRVLLGMAPGLSIKEVAKLLGVTEATAKTHLQRIYAKTHTSKLTELMHLFERSTPPVRTLN